MPLQKAGMRIEPATSVATPNREPRMAMRAPSPPELPPAVRVRRRGLRVRPKTLFSESAVMKLGGVRMDIATLFKE